MRHLATAALLGGLALALYGANDSDAALDLLQALATRARHALRP